ncbi:hypothetical protein BJF78_02390 [Pseudonocardia sp. CNS-139]|nr:hypothetical protein BJF78_02390 [Pseudonocardia sp. CNS-139]
MVGGGGGRGPADRPGPEPVRALLYFGNSYNFEGALRSGGGSMVDAGETRPEFDSPAGTAVFGFWRDLVAKGYMPVYSNFFAEATDAFTRGAVAMYLTSASGYEGLKKAGFDLRLAPMPTPDGAQRLVPLSTNGFVMLTTDPARQAATCDALLSVLTPESVTATVRATATAPLNRVAATGRQYLGGYFAENPDLVAVNDQPSFPWYAFPGTGNAEFQTEYLKAQLLVLQGRSTPEAALQGLATTAQRLLDQR